MALFAIIGLCVLAVNGDSIGDDADLFTLALTLQSSTSVDIGQSAFNQMFWDSPEHILKRECSTCGSTHQVIYYKRYTDLDSFDLYTYTYDWESTNNLLGEDFNLFSTLEDALADTNAWSYCNYDDDNIGMFRDCGPNSYVGGEWTSKTRGGDSAAFYIYTAQATAAPTEFHCGEHGCDDQLVCEETTGQCMRNCDVFKIDEFLLDCSAEWGSNENTVAAMATSISDNSADIATVDASAASNAADIASNAADIATVDASANSNAAGIASNAADIVNLTTEMSSMAADLADMQSSFDIVETALNQMAALSAHAQVANVDASGAADVVGAYALSTKDCAIIALLVINIVMIIGVVMACAMKAGRRSKYHAVNVVSE